ncbi:hypothetical protein ACFV0D_17265, partial [Streptomyces sp. NPDC059556]
RVHQHVGDQLVGDQIDLVGPVPGPLWATPGSYFSVIAPEAAASILKRPPEESAATADRLRLRPQDLLELGVVRGVVES